MSVGQKCMFSLDNITQHYFQTNKGEEITEHRKALTDILPSSTMIFQGRVSQCCQTDGCCSEYGTHNMCLMPKCIIAGSCKLNVVLNICDLSLERCIVSKGLTNFPQIFSGIVSNQHWIFKLRRFLYTLAQD